VKFGTTGYLMVVALLASACDAAEGVRVQPLPPLEGSTPEARAGLPEIEGDWRFAGWELAPADSALLASPLPSLGAVRIQTQRLDSIAGSYLVPGAQIPLVGEVRRDSVVALVALTGDGGRFLAGRISADTLWLSLTTLLEPGSWPTGSRAAFVRSPVAATFARLEGQRTVLPGDTVPPVLAGEMELPAPDTTRMATEPVTQRDVRPTQPAEAVAERAPAAAPPAAPPAARPAQPEQPRATPPVAAPAQPPPAPPAADPPSPRRPRLLGEPVDTVPG
jgi:hypothetical protein